MQYAIFPLPWWIDAFYTLEEHRKIHACKHFLMTISAHEQVLCQVTRKLSQDYLQAALIRGGGANALSHILARVVTKIEFQIHRIQNRKGGQRSKPPGAAAPKRNFMLANSLGKRLSSFPITLFSPFDA